MERLAPADRSVARCPWCHDDVAGGSPARPCDRCAAPHHDACWAEAGGCAACGAAAAKAIAEGPPPARLRVRERDGALVIDAPQAARSPSGLVVGLLGAVALVAAAPCLFMAAFGAWVLVTGGDVSPPPAAGRVLGPTSVGLVLGVLSLLAGSAALRAAAWSCAGVHRIAVGPREVTLDEVALGTRYAPTERIPVAGLEVGLGAGAVWLDAPGAPRLTVRHLRADEAAWFAAVLRTRLAGT